MFFHDTRSKFNANNYLNLTPPNTELALNLIHQPSKIEPSNIDILLLFFFFYIYISNYTDRILYFYLYTYIYIPKNHIDKSQKRNKIDV